MELRSDKDRKGPVLRLLDLNSLSIAERVARSPRFKRGRSASSAPPAAPLSPKKRSCKQGVFKQYILDGLTYSESFESFSKLSASFRVGINLDGSAVRWVTANRKYPKIAPRDRFIQVRKADFQLKNAHRQSTSHYDLLYYIIQDRDRLTFTLAVLRYYLCNSGEKPKYTFGEDPKCIFNLTVFVAVILVSEEMRKKGSGLLMIDVLTVFLEEYDRLFRSGIFKIDFRRNFPEIIRKCPFIVSASKSRAWMYQQLLDGDFVKQLRAVFRGGGKWFIKPST